MGNEDAGDSVVASLGRISGSVKLAILELFEMYEVVDHLLRCKVVKKS